jgi:hypothetical protein
VYRNAWHEWLLTKEQKEREIFLDNGVRDLRAAWKNNRKVLCLRLLHTASIKHRRNRTVCDEFILRSNRRKIVNTVQGWKRFVAGNSLFWSSQIQQENQELSSKLKILEATKIKHFTIERTHQEEIDILREQNDRLNAKLRILSVKFFPKK